MRSIPAWWTRRSCCRKWPSPPSPHSRARWSDRCKTVLGWQIAKLVKVEPGQPRTLDQVQGQDPARSSPTGRQPTVVGMSPTSSTIRWPAAPRWRRRPRSSAFRSRPSPPSPANGMDAAGKPIAELIGTPQLLPTAFAPIPGQTSTQIEDGAGGYFILRVDQVTPAGAAAAGPGQGQGDWPIGRPKRATRPPARQAAKIVDRIKAGRGSEAPSPNPWASR